MGNKVVNEAHWQLERDAILKKEKALTAAHDELAAARRMMSWQSVNQKEYRFYSEAGEHSLDALFDGRAQLIVYHHMLKPQDQSPCAGCCMVLDNIGHLAHLHARNTSFVVVSKTPLDEITVFKKRMAWTMPWFSSTDSFSEDFGVSDGFGLNVFVQDKGSIFRTYFTSGRGVEALGSNWSLLDITPLGRGETWEQSPQAVEQIPPYSWWRLHDEY